MKLARIIFVASALLVPFSARVEAAAKFTKVQELAVENGGVCPGLPSAIILKGVTTKGKVEDVGGFGQGLHWRVTTDLGSVQDGMLIFPEDPRRSWGKQAMLKVTWKDDPSVTAEISVPARYDCDFAVSFDGDQGNPGVNGAAGADANASGGGGGRGESGLAGGNGGRGADVSLEVGATVEPTGGGTILQFRIGGNGRSASYFVAIDGGHLRISANGGAGGVGGAGGAGGEGYAPTKSGETGGDGGDGGRGGNGADGGDGGRITVSLDPGVKATDVRSVLELVNTGGAAGAGGAGGAGGIGSPPRRYGRSGENGYQGREGRPGPSPSFQDGD